ncbi:MAG TPA: hypothetical protein V6C81_05270 [Planktothrix sp.]|jgi:hypothetical protein
MTDESPEVQPERIIGIAVRGASEESVIHITPPHTPIGEHLRTATVAVLGYLVFIAIIGVAFNPITAAKIVCVTVFGGLALTCLGVVLFRKWILVQLITLEEMGFLLQEETIVGARQARVQMRTVQERLDQSLHPVEVAILPELMKNVGPLVNMLLKKEKSTVNWVMFGLKIGKQAFDAFKQRK